MQKIVINTCYGGFGLSEEALQMIAVKKNVDTSDFDHYDLDRDDPVMVSIVEELGSKANDKFAQLKVVEIPDDVEWRIMEYGGVEYVAEKHRTWC